MRMGDALYVVRPSFAASSIIDTSAPVADVGVIEGALSFRLGQTRCFGFAVPLFTVAPSAKRPRFDKSLESVEVTGRTMLRVQDDATGRVMVLGVLNDPANCTMLHAHWEGRCTRRSAAGSSSCACRRRRPVCSPRAVWRASSTWAARGAPSAWARLRRAVALAGLSWLVDWIRNAL